jgi:cytochrome P450
MTVEDPARPLFELEPEAIRCPFDAYAHLREEAPVCFVDRLNAFVVTRYDDVMEVLSDPGRFSSAKMSGPHGPTELARRIISGDKDVGDHPERDRLVRLAARRLEVTSVPALINADPPLHNRQRRLVNRAFTPRQIAKLEPRIQALADELVDRFADDGRVEIMSQFCVELPLIVIADALGVSREDRGDFRRWSDAFVTALGNPGLTVDELLEMFGAMSEFYDYFTERIAERERTPTDDLLTQVVEARLDGDALTLNERLQILTLFLVAGNETTTNMLGSAILRLVTDPPLMATVRQDRALVPTLVEEILRLESPSPGLYRVVTEDTELGGVPLPAGSYVFMLFHSGNHDPRRFPRGGDLDLDAPPTPPHLAFGFGEHYCLGAPLARSEGRIGLNSLLDRLDDISLEGRPEDIPYFRSFAIRGPRNVPLTFRAAVRR